MPFKSLHTIRKKFITIVLLYVGLFSIKAQVQEPSLLTLQNTTETTESEIARLTEFVKNAEVFNYLYPQEKVYLHFDNSGYFLGETIWFKAYVVNSTTNKYTDLSKVLYVELLSPEGRVLDTQKLKIEDGQCNGQFLLTKIIHAGFYEIRAYTRMMLNWDSELIYSRVFPVFNAPQKEAADMYKSPKMSRLPYSQRLPNQRIKASHLEDINLSFFPEGGSLIEGITSTVSFKANDKQGNALDVSGTIYNKQKETITVFDTYYNGMGKFDFTPVKGEKYKAEIILNEKTYSFDLPSALSQGVVLSMNTMRNDCIILQVEHNDDKMPPLGLSVMCRGEIVYFKKIDWDNQSKTLFRIPKDKLLAGVNQFTLFDEEGRIYAERLAFIHPANEINITCTLDKEKYEDREAVEIDFKLTDKKRQPIETTFSLSVRDANKDTPVNNYSSNIKSNLLLSSDLKGFIENVDYYIESDDLAHRSALDLLLTTQGWRRYDWKQITRPQDFKVNHPIEEGIMVIGELKSTMRKRVKAGAEIKIWIMNDEGSYQKGSCFTDSLGKFAFVSEDFEGRWKMNIQTKEKNKQKEMRINLDKAFSPQPRAYTSTETTLFEKQKKYIVNNKEDKQSSSNDISHEWENLLPIVEVNADKIWNSKFIMKWNNIIYDIDNERDRMDDTGENYLQPFYEWLEKNNSYFHYNLLDTLTATYKGKQVYFLSHRGDASAKLDDDAGVNIDLEQLTINDLDAISISDKPLAIRALRPAFFRVIKNVTISDSISQLVVISLFIKKEYFAQRDKKGERFSQLQGYSQVRQFYVSDHSDSALPNENKYRRTLYWNPNVRTNANGEAMIKFRNTESCRNMKINAETVMDTGLFGSLNSFLPCY